MHGIAGVRPMSTTKIQDYRIAETVYENERFRISRGYFKDNPRPLLIKTLCAPFPDAADVNRFRREYDITRILNTDETNRAVDFPACDNGFALVMEDAGGESLANLLRRRLPGIVPFLRLSIRITEALGRIHNRDVIHRNINPNSITVDRKNGAARIVDFSISTRSDRTVLTSAPAEISGELELQGALPYISPEQTGRMNRIVDQRSDFYSLGATFYEMLTGRPPFGSEGLDALEIIHCHIAVQPEPPTLAGPMDSEFRELPPVVGSIVMKLLAKNPEDRYQSAFGLKADLQKCLALWKDEGGIPNFEIGASDISGKFLLPQRLYGREPEIHGLRDLFRRCSNGETNFLLVKGVTGIGKSSLVYDVRRYVAEHRGIFISGAYAELRRDVPYTAFIQAFQDMVRQILTEPEESVQRWRRRLREILGPNGSVIADVIPDIELIVGPQEEALQLPAAESQNRFHSVFRGFVRGFADADHPLVLFLDDLHWADAASLQLIKSLVTDPDTRHILLIGAYRDGDAVETRNITQLAVDLSRIVREPEAILLGPLTREAVRTFVADLFPVQPEQTGGIEALAELVHSKTGGNPFFLNEFLRTLYHDRLIDFNSSEGVWQWNLDDIRARNITENVADLLTDRIRRLPEESQAVLQQAACIGQTFDLYNLAIMHQKTEAETARLLAAPLREGMIVPVGDDNLISGDEPADDTEDRALLSVRYRFMHDRVLQAAYALLDEDRKTLGHSIVGRHLLRTIPEHERDEHLIDIVNHLNQGAGLIQKPGQRMQLAELNLAAGLKAKRSAAYETAAYYIENAKALLPDDPWRTAYELTLAIYRETVEIKFLAGQAAEAHRLAGEVLEQTHTLLDRIPIYDAQIRSYNGAGDLGRGLETGLRVLEQLGVKIPRQPGRRHQLLARARMQRALDNRKWADLIDLPQMTDPARAAAIRLLGLIMPNAYVASPDHLPVLVYEGIRLILQSGVTTYAPTMFIGYALLNASNPAYRNDGAEAAEFAMRLSDRLNARETRHRVMFTDAAFVQHWREPIHDTLRDLETAARYAVEVGDYVYYAYAGFHFIAHQLLAGVNLDAVDADFTRLRALVGSYKQHLMAHHIDCFGQVIANLRDGESDRNPIDLDGGRFAASVGAMIFEQLGGRSGIFYIHSMQAYLAYLFGDIETAVRASEDAERFLKYTAGSFATVRQVFIAGLITAAAARATSGAEQRDHLKQAELKLAHLREWDTENSTNVAHAACLLDAELASILGENQRAAELYDRAQELAAANRFTQDEALANELAGEFYRRLGREKIAHTYFNDAYSGYARWGAAAKMAQLSRRYPDYFTDTAATESAKPQRALAAGEAPRVRGGRDALDLNTVLQATRALSGEIELEQLLDRLIGVLLRSAGAERGLFLLPVKGKGQLFIEAEQHPARKIHESLMHIPLNSSKGAAKLPVPLVDYVRRTGESVVLSDAAGDPDGMFARVDYIVQHRVRSILCTPIKMHGQLSGILYLENNLSAGAFTPDRVELLEILGAQAAISLENAVLYEEQKSLTDSFARFVPNEFLNVLHRQTIRDIHRGDAVEREITVLFQDIRGFTTLSESMDPTATFRFLNELLERIASPISQSGGFIDKYIGDAIMALFPGPPDDGLRAAILMLRELREFNRERSAKGETPVNIGIGLHTGVSLFGTVGIEDRLSTTVIGDTVNAASRLESATKKYGIPILISGAMVERLQNPETFHIREVDHVRLKGKKNVSILFEVFDHEETEAILRKRRALPAYTAALEKYRAADFAVALWEFEAVLRAVPGDTISLMYMDRCRHWLDNPPGPEWTHLNDLREK